MGWTGGLLGAALLFLLGLRARLTAFSFIVLVIQVPTSLLMVLSTTGSYRYMGHLALPVLAGAMLAIYVVTLMLLVKGVMRGDGFSFRIATRGFTLGALCIVILLSLQMAQNRPSLVAILAPANFLMLLIFILPPVTMALSLWRADRIVILTQESVPERAGEGPVPVSELPPSHEEKGPGQF